MGVARLYQAAAPLNASELFDVDHVQSFDVMYLAHINYNPLKLSRLGHTDWAFAEVAFAPTIAAPTGVSVLVTDPNQDLENDGNAFFPQEDTYVVSAVSATQESRPSAPVSAINDLSLKRNKNTIGWDAVAAALRYKVFKSHNGGDFAFIGTTEALSFVDDNIEGDQTLGPIEGQNPFSGEGDKPSAVTFFEGRLWWGRTLNLPNALYSSRSADFENMDTSVPLRPDDAITIGLVSQGVNQANYLVPLGNLLVFASDALIKIEGTNEDYLSASPPPRQRVQGNRGSSRLKPIVVDRTAFFQPDRGEQIRAARYKFEANGIESVDVSIFSPHFFEGFTIVDWCYAEEPLSIIWAARSDGALLAFTWEEEHDVWGWTICPLAAGGKVKSLCVIKEFGESRVYAIIERTFAGVTRTYRERMASARWRGLANECHLDCAVSRTFEEPSNEIDGLWLLEGATVEAFCDGIVYSGLVVEGGRTFLPEGVTCSTAHVGFGYDALFETLPLSFPTRLGASQGNKQQTGKAVLKLVRSRAPDVGLRIEKMYPLKAQVPFSDPTSDASLLSGIFPIATEPLNRYESTALVRTRIAPLTVTAVYLDVEGNGD